MATIDDTPRERGHAPITDAGGRGTAAWYGGNSLMALLR
jgi:hypothetical protein